MKTALLSTVAVAALAASIGVASAQMDKGGGASGGGVERSAPSGNTPSSGAGGMERGAPGNMDRNSGATERSPSGQSEPSPRAQNPSDGKNAQAPAKTGDKMGMDKGTDKNGQTQRSGDAKQNMPDKSNNAQAPSNSTVGAAPASQARLTTEQRTQIRERVIPSGPKATNINFALNVGTVVPRTVRVEEVPSVIVDIHPEWRGYRYFVANEQIIIVDRDTLRIIAVLDV